MADVNAENITDDDVTKGGKYLVYAIFTGIGGVIVIIILVALAVLILEKFGLINFIGMGKRK